MSSSDVKDEGVLTHYTQGSSMILWIINQPLRRTSSGPTYEGLKSRQFSTGLKKENTWHLGWNKIDYGGAYCSLSLYLDESTSPEVQYNVEFGITELPTQQICKLGNWKSLRKGSFIDVAFPANEVRTAYESVQHQGGLKIQCRLTVHRDPPLYKRNVTCSMNELQTPEHSISKDFASMMENGKLSDIELVMGEQKLQAHKVVLAFRSPVFMAMFENKMQESLLNKVDIPDIRFEVMQKLLLYIYTDTVEDVEELAEDLLAAAEKYQLDGLKSICSDIIIKKLKLDNVIASLVLGDLYHANDLKKRSINFIIEHIEDLEKLEGFEELGSAHAPLLKEILIHISKAKVV